MTARRWLAAFLFAFAATPVWGADPTSPPTLEEGDACLLQRIMAEREALQQRFLRAKAESDRIAVEVELIRILDQEKRKALEAATAEAARKAGLDPKEGWRPDLERRSWAKP